MMCGPSSWSGALKDGLGLSEVQRKKVTFPTRCFLSSWRPAVWSKLSDGPVSEQESSAVRKATASATSQAPLAPPPHFMCPCHVSLVWDVIHATFCVPHACMGTWNISGGQDDMYFCAPPLHGLFAPPSRAPFTCLWFGI